VTPTGATEKTTATATATATVRLIVTRPAEQALPWVQQLQQQGCDAVALPLIHISPLPNTQPLQQAWLHVQQGRYALVMFVSANAVQQFFAACDAQDTNGPVPPPQAHRWPVGCMAGSTGPGTTAALLAHGVPASAVVAPAADAPTLDTEALWQQLRHQPWAGRQVLLVRGEDGRDWLADTLRAHGAAVQLLAAYRRSAPVLMAAEQALLQAALQAPQQHVWLLSSSEAVGYLVQLVQQGQLAQAPQPGQNLHASQAWASHPRIAQTARDAGFGQVLLLQPDLLAVVQQARLATGGSAVSPPASLLQSRPL
jgi:uroporphyrinogen-III synthase